MTKFTEKEISILVKSKGNPRLMSAKLLEKNGIPKILEKITWDSTFNKFLLKDKMGYIISGCKDVWCPICKIGRVRPSATYCSQRCAALSNRENSSRIMRENAKERMQKTRETYLRLYGVLGNNYLPEVIEKRRETRKVSDWKKRKETFVAHGIDYDLVSNPRLLQEKVEKYDCLQELIDHVFFNTGKMVVLRFLKDMGIKHNYYSHQRSYWEKQVFAFIESLGFHPEANNRTVLPKGPAGRNNLELDIWIPERRLGIECNGIWYHHGKECGVEHKFKQEWMEKHGYSLIQIFDCEWEEKKDLIKSLIKSRLGIFDRKIHARKCNLINVTAHETREFLDKNHIQGSCGGTFRVGLEYEGELVQLVVIGKNRFAKDSQLELIRSCSKSGVLVVGGIDRLLKHVISSHGKITTYCSPRLFSGKSYERNGEFLSWTPPGYFWIHRYNGEIVSRQKSMKSNLKHLLGEHFDPSKTEVENMEENNYLQIFDAGQKKYLLG